MANGPIFYGNSGWVPTRFGPVRTRLDEDRDVYELYHGPSGHGRFFGYMSVEAVHRLGGISAIQTAITNKLRDHLEREAEEAMNGGEHRRDDQEGQEGDPGEDGPRAEEGAGPGDDAGADEEAREGPREDLEPAVAGWRGWQVEGLKLRPSAFDGVWHHTEVNRAVCHRNAYNPYQLRAAADYFRHEAPAEDCLCGFWAYRTRAYMTEDAPDNLDVFGVVALGGDVVETVHGFRAAEARIVALLDSPPARNLEAWWNSGAEVTADGTLKWNWRSSGADLRGRGTQRGRFPIPILSELECEMLAIEQGCVFETEPRRDHEETREIGQYVVLSGGVRDRRYRNTGDHQEPAPASVVFAPVDEPPFGAVRVDNHHGPIRATPTGRLYRASDAERLSLRMEGVMVTLVRTIVRRPNGPDVEMWCVDGHLNDRDFALQEARERYGDGWLKRYEV